MRVSVARERLVLVFLLALVELGEIGVFVVALLLEEATQLVVIGIELVVAAEEAVEGVTGLSALAFLTVLAVLTVLPALAIVPVLCGV